MDGITVEHAPGGTAPTQIFIDPDLFVVMGGRIDLSPVTAEALRDALIEVFPIPRFVVGARVAFESQGELGTLVSPTTYQGLPSWVVAWDDIGEAVNGERDLLVVVEQ